MNKKIGADLTTKAPLSTRGIASNMCPQVREVANSDGELLSFSCHADEGRIRNSSRPYEVCCFSEDVEHNFAKGLFSLLFPRRICLKYD